MSTATTLRLPLGLRKRIASLARASDKSAQAWMLDTIAAQVAREELGQAFLGEGLESLARVAEGEPVYDADEVFAYARAKVAGRKARRPVPRSR